MRILLARTAGLYDRSGGMEQAEARLAWALSNRGYAVGVVSYDSVPGHPYFQFPGGVSFFNLQDGLRGKMSPYMAGMKVIRELVRPFSKSAAMYWKDRRKISYLSKPLQQSLDTFQPDIIISLDGASSAVLFGVMKNLTIPVITMFHFPARSAINWEDRQERQALVKSSCVQVLTPEDVIALKQMLPGVQAVCIPNVVPQYEKTADLKRSKEHYIIMHVGRLVRQKRQYLLIQAFARLADIFPAWNLEFWGEERNGHSYTDELQQLVHQYHLEGRVLFRGTAQQLLPHYLAADIFAFPSAYEGFGLAPAEAMSAGLPVIAYRSCEAMRSLLEDGKNGMLVNDGEESLAGGLKQLMDNRALRIRLGEAGKTSVKKYAPQRVEQQWEELLLSLAHDTK